ncbi:hypothetical protein AZE42_09254 [Rhizopogon vesiculosus]|uniref:DUF7770 domain-containing protein n=1 Tax=Rhizopogon vesiculosus TaxID=180088 RepID=A0A1J8Q8T1_9AGAM|nr:hypothetical protein AZE42_09254 [Rhizopogon vesiculosus]
MSISTVVTHIFNVDNNWGTSQFPSSALTEAVQQVHFCAHANTENAGSDGQSPTNHWSMFLEIDPNRSVGVDVVPGDLHSPGMIILEMIETKDCSVLNENVYDIHSGVPEGTTVETILGLIIDKGRDRYMFTTVGEGCRYWLQAFARDMVDAHLLSSEVAERASDVLACYWKYPVGSECEPRVMGQGRFF